MYVDRSTVGPQMTRIDVLYALRSPSIFRSRPTCLHPPLTSSLFTPWQSFRTAKILAIFPKLRTSLSCHSSCRFVFHIVHALSGLHPITRIERHSFFKPAHSSELNSSSTSINPTLNTPALPHPDDCDVRSRGASFRGGGRGCGGGWRCGGRGMGCIALSLLLLLL